jgi:enoyl-CoA hydratase/carnithine racemase
VGTVEVDRSNAGVSTIWLSNPGRMNALSNAMLAGICDEMTRLAGDGDCRAIVFRGRDKVFCAGRDLREARAMQSAGLDEIDRMFRLLKRTNELVYFSPHPVISVVERIALGLGNMLACWSDIVLAETTAMFGFPEIHLGVTPYGAVPTMLNTMSQKVVMDLLLTGRQIDAREALRLGIISRAVSTAELEASLDEVLQYICRGNAAAITKSKQFVRRCETLSYEQGMAAAHDSVVLGFTAAERTEGVTAFLERRNADLN